MKDLLNIWQREVAIHMARRSEWFSVILFYLICTSLFPIILGGFAQENMWLAPIIIWIAVLLALILAQESLLREDFRLGVFDIMLLHHRPFGLLLLIKTLAHWCIFACPIVLLTPLVSISFGLSVLSITVISISLFIGTLFLSLMSAVAAALTVPLARGGTFIAVLILPLYMPILIIGSNLGILSVDGFISYAHFAILGALTIGAFLFAPLLTSVAVRVSTA